MEFKRGCELPLYVEWRSTTPRFTSEEKLPKTQSAKYRPVRRRRSALRPSVPEAKVSVDREEVARLAYSYWQARVRVSSEEDWYRAETEILARSARNGI